MLQRAASNAYTWWWASHIRKKQSKWLDQNLQEMEEKVKAMLTIIEEDGDSFAKRAEMYYRKRPELIHFVEESYKAYRALAQRYDHISGELQNANNTIATVFPDKVQFAMEEDEEDGSIKASPPIPGLSCDKVYKNPNWKGVDRDLSSLPSKSSEIRRSSSVMNKATVQEEIDKLQKGILVLQTEKEFIKSSYETRLTKYWQIEKQITEMQEYISNLQDELGGGVEIEDDEARALMAATAIKTCEDALFQLRELQKKSREDVIVEAQRIKGVQERLNVIKNKTSLDKKEFKESSSAQDIELIVIKDLTEAVSCLKQERRELQSISEMVKKHFEFNSDNADSVAELAEKIDELVNKVINLETSVSLQTAQIKQLKSGNDKIQQELNVLEEDDDLINRKGKIKEVEDELQGIKNLNQSIVSQDQELQARFYVACDTFDNISEKLQNKKSDEESPLDEKLLTLESHEFKEEQKIDKETEQQEEIHEINDLNSHCLDEKEIPKHSESRNNVEEHYENLEYPKIEEEEEDDDEMQKQCTEQEDCLNWKQLFLNGMEDREKILLAEYTSVLRNYKEAKKKMIDLEKKNQDTLFENLGQIRQLKSANAMKDDEIRTLRQKLKLLELSSDASTDLNLIEEDEINGKYRPVDLSNDISDQKKLEHPLNDEEIVPVLRDETPSGSKLEEKFRRDIDELLGENLEFWLRFSSSFEQIQKFQADVQDLQAEFSKLKTENIDNKDHNRSSTSSDQSVKSECTSISNNLKEIQKEFKVWLEQNALLKEELQGRLSSLAEIQEELSRVCKIDSTNNEGNEFTTYQASKFQGEISNMQQENKKVADELQVGLDHVKGLQVEVEKVLSKLQEDFDLPGSKTHGHHYQHLKNSINRTRIPLRSFLFGVKQKKPSIFSCMSPALQKQYSDLRRGNANVN